MGYSKVMDKHPLPHSQKHEDQKHLQASPQPALPENSLQNDLNMDHDVKTILAWHASGRPFRQRTFEFFLNSFLIMIALEIILFLFSQYILMLVVFSLVFLSFALAVVPPQPFYYKITTEGVRVEDHVFIWEELYDFYFMKQHDQNILYIRTKSFFPGELILTLGDIPLNQVKNALFPYLPYREYVKPTFVDQAGEWLEQNFPLEKRTS
jgi:hypothetical protein